MEAPITFDRDHYANKWNEWERSPSGVHTDITERIHRLYELIELPHPLTVVTNSPSEFYQAVLQHRNNDTPGTFSDSSWFRILSSIATLRRRNLDWVIDHRVDHDTKSYIEGTLDRYIQNGYAHLWIILVEGILEKTGVGRHAALFPPYGVYNNPLRFATVDVMFEEGLIDDPTLKRNFYTYVDVIGDSCVQYFENTVAIVLVKAAAQRDASGRLHSEDGKAITWGSAGHHYLHGVHFRPRLWRLVLGKELSFKDIMGLQNIEHRWIALKYMDVDELLASTNATLLDSSSRGNQLYLIKGLFPNRYDAYFLRYSCPSTSKVYLSGVSLLVGMENDADRAMAWKHHVTKSDYLKGVPLITES